MGRTIASLFEAVTGGNDWAGIAEDMRAVSESLYCCFALYVVFVSLGVLNIVTGFFVDGTMQANVNAREEMLKQAQEKKNTMIHLVGELFTQLDTDQSGKLSYEELDSHLHDEALQEYFCVLEMEPEEAKDLFCLLDIRGEGEVSITDFTNGCLKIMGAPKNLDKCTFVPKQKNANSFGRHSSQHSWQKRQMRMQMMRAWSCVSSVHKALSGHFLFSLRTSGS